MARMVDAATSSPPPGSSISLAPLPSLPVDVYQHGDFKRRVELDDPRALWVQRFNGSNRRLGLWAEIPVDDPVSELVGTLDDTDVDYDGDRWQPILPNMERVYAEFAKRLPGCVMAGGAVRDTLLGRRPRDFDLFTFEPIDRGALAGLNVVTSRVDLYASLEVLTLDWLGAKVQVIYSDGCENIEELLDSFDWNICLFAFDGRLHQRMDPANIGEGKQLFLHHCNSPLRVLRRGFRFAERYGMTIQPNHLADLCERVFNEHVERFTDLPDVLPLAG